MKVLSLLINSAIIWPMGIHALSTITESNENINLLENANRRFILTSETAVTIPNSSAINNTEPMAFYYSPTTDDNLAEDSLSDDFVTAMEQFLFSPDSVVTVPSAVHPVAIGMTKGITFSMDDDAVNAIFSLSVNTQSGDNYYWIDRVHSLCSNDVASLCHGRPFLSSPSSVSNPISLGYKCKKIEACLYNALDQRALSQPCGQAILELHVIQSAPTTTRSQAATSSHTTSLPERTLAWLRSHELMQKILALLLSLIILHLALFPRHFIGRSFGFRHHHHRAQWVTKRKVLNAIHDDAQLFEHVQRVLGESLDRNDIVPNHPCIHRRPNLLRRVATCILPKTTLMALILFLSWTSPLFMTLFLGFHVMMTLFLFMIGWMTEACFSPEPCVFQENGMDRGLVEPLIVTEPGDETMLPVFVGVPLKIVKNFQVFPSLSFSLV